MDAASIAKQLSAALPEGGRLAVGDGAGCPTEAWGAVDQLLSDRPDVSVLLGWWFRAPEVIGNLNARQVSTVISGFGMRRLIDSGAVGFLPIRLGAMANLLNGPLRADVLLTSLRPVERGFAFSTEVGWERAVIDSGATVLAVARPNAPVIETGPSLEEGSVVVIAESDLLPATIPGAAPTDEQRATAEHVSRLIPDGARIQVGPGALGAAVYAAIDKPISVDSGIITDPVVDLDRRGLLVGPAYAPYVAGTEMLYDWAPGRVVVDRIEVTHSNARLSGGRPLVAVNTGLEIDLDGQVNAETVRGSWMGGIGGQPDYALGASLSRDGLSVMALTTESGGNPTLVERLQGPVTTLGHDIDVVVTERGSVDLRGLSRPERRSALRALWGSIAP